MSMFNFIKKIRSHVNAGKDIQGNGDVISEHRKVDAFQEIELNGNIHFSISKGKPALTVKGDSNLLQYVKTENINGFLKVTVKERVNPLSILKVSIRTSELVSLKLNGSSKGKIRGIDEDRFTINLSGASNISITGKIRDFALNISGAGILKAKKCEIERCSVVISGAGNAIVNVSEDLKVNISGAGRLSYFGDPQIDKKISGLGTIKQL